jgi:hypothetical protein
MNREVRSRGVVNSRPLAVDSQVLKDMGAELDCRNKDGGSIVVNSHPMVVDSQVLMDMGAELDCQKNDGGSHCCQFTPHGSGFTGPEGNGH